MWNSLPGTEGHSCNEFKAQTYKSSSSHGPVSSAVLLLFFAKCGRVLSLRVYMGHGLYIVLVSHFSPVFCMYEMKHVLQGSTSIIAFRYYQQDWRLHVPRRS
jgi:hypothetical protein